MFVCTQVASSRSLRPFVTLACLASCTTRTLSHMHRLRWQGLFPAPKCTSIGYLMEGPPAEPAQHQAVGHPPLAFFVAPLVEVFEDQHAQQHFHRRRMSPMHQGGAIPRAFVGSHLLIQRIIVEQAVQLVSAPDRSLAPTWVPARRHLRAHSCPLTWPLTSSAAGTSAATGPRSFGPARSPAPLGSPAPPVPSPIPDPAPASRFHCSEPTASPVDRTSAAPDYQPLPRRSAARSTPTRA